MSFTRRRKGKTQRHKEDLFVPLCLSFAPLRETALMIDRHAF